MFDLLHTILWHLAAFGQPVPEGVLCRCPRIVAATEHLIKEERQGIASLSKLVEFAVEILINRCLIIPIQSEPHRVYTVHRTIQLHLLRLLGSPAVEYQTVNQFTVTSYMTQPRDMPRLRQEAHSELRRTISALIGFPDAHGTVNGPVDDQSLQAALAMMRSVYSVASIARLGSQEGEPISPSSDAGLFGDHFRQVRWLLHAHNVQERNAENTGGLTRDQIVWALNECGVMSLIRGNIGEAAILFDFADRNSKEIEPHENDPTRNRIFINRALALIERGQGRDILPRLKAISDDTSEHPALRAIAIGYQGLVSHISGRYDFAEVLYERSLRYLSAQDRARPASFVARNYANLLRSTKRLNDADVMIQRAVTFADEGSHQDVLQEALVARCAIWIRQDKHKSQEVHAQLNAAEQYTRTMGMYRLLSEIHRLRGVLRLESGDYSQASRDFAESLRISVANRQKLKVVSSLVHLAEAQTETGAFESCAPMLDLAIAMAQATDHHAGLMHAERLRMRKFGKVSY